MTSYLDSITLPTISFLVWLDPRTPLASNDATRLEDARAALHGKKTVCFLGEVKSGKTVSSSLLKHAVVNHFVRDRPNDYESVVSQGMDTVNRSLGEMIMHRRFPAATLPVSDPKVVLDIYKMSGGGAGKFEIILQDSSGEHFFKYLISECRDPHARLREVLEHSLGSGRVGPLAHYVFAKIYIITIDCSDIAALEHKQSLHANSIVTLHRLHTAASLTHNEKIRTPIAILFTKVDLLSENDSRLPAAKLLDAMPELKSALALCHGGDLDCFKVSISTSVESKSDQDERVEHARREYDKERAKAAEQSRAVDEKIAGKCAQERKRIEYDTTDAALEAHMSEYEEKLRAKLGLNIPTPKQFDEDKIRREQTRRPNKPLAYTHEEYVRLIMWIISHLVGST